jgi:thiol-disulfide isomerase/thioredoxin
MRTALVGVVVLVGTSHAEPALDDAIKQAAAANKPLVIEFSAAWCGPCKVFEKDVLPDPLVQSSLQHVVFVHYDAEVSPGLEAASRYDVGGFPTFLVIDKGGGVGAKNVGFLDRNHFIDFVEDAGNHLLDETSVRIKLRAHGKDPAVQLSAARWFETHHLVLDAVSNYEAVAKNPAATTAVRAEAKKTADHLRRIDAWRHDLIADKVAAITADPVSASTEDIAIATVGSDLAMADIKKLYAVIFKATTNDTRVNELVYLALAAGANDQALAAAQADLAVAHSPQYLDTLAECFHVAGDSAEALRLEDEAMQSGAYLGQKLALSRARFAAGTGDSDEVIVLRARTAALWKQLEAADQLPPGRGVAPAMNQQMTNMRKAIEVERKVAESIATTCAKEAGKSEVAYVRFDLDPKNLPTLIDVLVDDSATGKLRACIKRELGAATTLLPRPAYPRGKRELRIPFKKP